MLIHHYRVMFQERDGLLQGVQGTNGLECIRQSLQTWTNLRSRGKNTPGG